MARLFCCLLAILLGASARADEPLPEGAVRRLGTTRWRVPQQPRDLAFSPDGKLVAIACEGPHLYLYEAATGKLARILTGNLNHPYRTLAFTPDGKHLASGGGYNSVPFVDVVTGQLVRTLEAPGNGNSRLAFTSDGKTLATTAEAGSTKIRLVDVATGNVREIEGGGPGRTLAFDRAGKKVLTAGYRAEAQIWEAATGRSLHTFAGNSTVVCAAWTPDSQAVVVGAINSLALWDLATNQELRRFGAVGSQAVAVSPDGKVLAATFSFGSKVQLWNLATGQLLRELDSNQPRFVSRLAFAPDGKTLAAIGDGMHISVWDTATGQLRTPLLGHLGSIHALAVTPDSKRVVSSGTSGHLLAWDLVTGKEMARLSHGYLHPLATLAPSPDSKQVAAGTHYDGPEQQKVWLWDLASGKELRRFGEVRSGSAHVQFVQGGKQLTGFCTTGELVFWDTATAQEQRRVAVGAHEVYGLTADGRFALTATRQHPHAVQLWRTADGKPLHSFHGMRTTLTQLALAPPGWTLAVGGYEDDVLVWELLTGMELGRLPGHGRGAPAVAFAHDGRLLASSARDEQIHLWDTYTGAKLKSLLGHVGGVRAMAFTPDGKQLITGGQDSTLLVWDLAKLLPQWPPAPPALAEAERERVWAELSGGGRQARLAITALVAQPRVALPLLRERLKHKGDDAQIAKLIAQLDDDVFRVRDEAMRALAKQGGAAEPLLRRALASTPSPELRRRAKVLLERLPAGVDGDDSRRLLRSVEVLERIGGAEARLLLGELAEIGGGAQLGQEARAAYERLGPAKAP